MHSRRKGREGQDKGKRKKEQGMVLLAAVVMMSGLVFVATTSSLNSIGQTKVTSVELEETRTFYAAEAAVEWGTNELRSILENNLDPEQDELDVLSRPTLEGYDLEFYEIEKSGTTTSEILTSGDYIGLYGYVQRYNIQARVSSERRSTGIVREIQHQYIPLFQFGVFYDKDLEIFPGVLMTFTGRVHTNANLYMGAEVGINCESYVTAIGKYWHQRKDNARPDTPGYVRIKDAHGVYQDVWRGSYWLDNRRATWANEALEVWEGQFRDESHGLSVLKLPLPPAADQHIIIERPLPGDGATEKAQKYYYKAGVRYIDGTLTDSLGNILSQPGVYTFTGDKFKDTRENKWMDVVDINIQTMIANNWVPANRIIYVSKASASYDGLCVRIKNAGTLPTGGLTIATDLPLYVWGHYNNVSKKGSALLCDAITLLSPNWLDANSGGSLGSRVPTTMNINCCVMTGHVPTPLGGTYSGGFENIFRFLEAWTSSINVNYRGSVIDLWDSRKATANWVYGGYYTAPKRNWGFDTDLLQPGNWPPGTPRVHTIQRGAWRQIS
jgi:hypothetical protein